MTVLITRREWLPEHQLWIDFGRMSCWRCAHTYPSLDHPVLEVGELIEMAARTGWQSIDGLDECPDCIVRDIGTSEGEERTGPADASGGA